jgi:hypothetical protein
LQFTRSNHKIETSEIGFNGQFALQKVHAAEVGSGSKARITAPQHCCPVSPQTADMAGVICPQGRQTDEAL